MPPTDLLPGAIERRNQIDRVAPFDDSLTAASSTYVASRRSAAVVRADGRCSPIQVGMHNVIQRHAGIVTPVSHAPNAHS